MSNEIIFNLTDNNELVPIENEIEQKVKPKPESEPKIEQNIEKPQRNKRRKTLRCPT